MEREELRFRKGGTSRSQRSQTHTQPPLWTGATPTSPQDTDAGPSSSSQATPVVVSADDTLLIRVPDESGKALGYTRITFTEPADLTASFFVPHATTWSRFFQALAAECSRIEARGVDFATWCKRASEVL